MREGSEERIEIMTKGERRAEVEKRGVTGDIAVNGLVSIIESVSEKENDAGKKMAIIIAVAPMVTGIGNEIKNAKKKTKNVEGSGRKRRMVKPGSTKTDRNVNAQMVAKNIFQTEAHVMNDEIILLTEEMVEETPLTLEMTMMTTLVTGEIETLVVVVVRRIMRTKIGIPGIDEHVVHPPQGRPNFFAIKR